MKEKWSTRSGRVVEGWSALREIVTRVSGRETNLMGKEYTNHFILKENISEYGLQGIWRVRDEHVTKTVLFTREISTRTVDMERVASNMQMEPYIRVVSRPTKWKGSGCWSASTTNTRAVGGMARWKVLARATGITRMTSCCRLMRGSMRRESNMGRGSTGGPMEGCLLGSGLMEKSNRKAKRKWSCPRVSSGDRIFP